MKKNIFLFLCCFGISGIGYSQIKINYNASTGSILNHSAFLDASSSSFWNGNENQAKGLLFPRANLTALANLIPSTSGSASFNPNRFDGMVVYNTVAGTAALGGNAVEAGFYYYQNTSTTSVDGGKWVPMGGVRAEDVSLNTISLSTASALADRTLGQNNGTVYCKGAFDLVLPAANSMSGKIFRISKTDEDNSVLTFSEDIYINSATTFNSLNYAKSIVIQSDGVNWTILN
jgi:hypothetical protein